MPTSLLKQHCYCPMLLMRTTKTAVCLQTKAIFWAGPFFLLQWFTIYRDPSPYVGTINQSKINLIYKYPYTISPDHVIEVVSGRQCMSGCGGLQLAGSCGVPGLSLAI